MQHGVVGDVVRRAERLDEGPGQVGEGAAAIGERDAAPAEGLDRLLQLVGDVVEGLVPGRPPPPAAATRTHADQRCLRSLVVVVLESQAGRPLGAEAGADGLVVRIALRARPPARPRPSLRSGNAPSTCRTCCRPCAAPGRLLQPRSVPWWTSSHSPSLCSISFIQPAERATRHEPPATRPTHATFAIISFRSTAVRASAAAGESWPPLASLTVSVLFVYSGLQMTTTSPRRRVHA